jgi:competence protein ComEA
MRRLLLLLSALALVLCGSFASAQNRPASSAANPIDLNSASRDVLMSLDGIGEVKADAIIRSRPFRAKTELVERHIIPEALYEKIADKVFARAPPPAPAPAPAKPAAPAPAGPVKRG